MKSIIYILIIFGAALAVESTHAQPPAKINTDTEWQIEPSFKYDTLCFLNVLTGDPFYRKYYEEEYARFESRLTPKARMALANLRRKLKDDNKNIVSAFLSTYFSASDAETIDEMLTALDNNDRIKANLQKTVYYNKPGWRLFLYAAKDLKVVLRFLKDERFDVYWRQEILPKIRDKTALIALYLSGYDIIPEVEKHLGFKFESKKIVVYALYFARPHGFRLTGTRFVTDISYPPNVVLRVAIHEMLHPPYKLKDDMELRKALDALRADEFLMDKIQNHDRSYGYNSFESYIEEDCVRALDQLIGERFGIENNARQRWKEEDNGMHVFAVALYAVMKQEKYDGRQENFREFLFNLLRSGKLAVGKIKSLYSTFYSAAE